jgi:hypothetical protein
MSSPANFFVLHTANRITTYSNLPERKSVRGSRTVLDEKEAQLVMHVSTVHIPGKVAGREWKISIITDKWNVGLTSETMGHRRARRQGILRCCVALQISREGRSLNLGVSRSPNSKNDENHFDTPVLLLVPFLHVAVGVLYGKFPSFTLFMMSTISSASE